MRIANQLNERLTLNQVASRLNVHVATIYRWTLSCVRGRRLPSFLIGGRRYVALPDLEQFLQPREPSSSDDDSMRSKRAQEQLRSYGIGSPKCKDGAE